MSSLGLSSHHGPFGQIERIIAGHFYRVVKQIARLPWFFSFLIFATLGFLYTIFTYYPLYFFRRKITRQCKMILSNLDKFDERVLMEIHLDYDCMLPKMYSISKVSNEFFVFRPLTNQFKIIFEEISRAHKIIEDYLYPDMERPLTPEEGAELIEAFKPWKENSKHIEFSSNG